MNRPDGLPTIDARTAESKQTASFLVTSCQGAPWVGLVNTGMVDTPTKAMQQSVEAGIVRQLQLRRRR